MRINDIKYSLNVWIGWGFFVLILGVGGCEEKMETEVPPHLFRQAVTLAVDGYGHIDSAQVFFFRKSALSDSLVLQQTVYEITGTPRPFRFDLPLGYYTILIFGNVAPDRIVYRAPYGRDSVWISYQGQEKIPAIYYGTKLLNVGVDTVGLSGMLLVTTAVEVTVRKVPSEVDKIEVSLLHTAAGIDFSIRLLKEPMQPPVSAVIQGVQTDSSYTVELSGFPTVDTEESSVVQIRCYNKAGEMIYSGNSEKFPAQQGRRRVVACSFANSSGTRSMVSQSGIYPFIWEYDEEPF